MIKIIIFVANIFFAQYIFAQSALAKEKITWIDFKWNDTTTKSAIFLRSRVDTFDYNFNWQLDTGSPYTFIYGTTWNIFKQRFPILSTLAKQTDSISKGNYRKVLNPHFMFNEHELFSDTILENENSGASFPGEYLDTYKGAGFLIGTAGLDMFKNRVLILDFKHNKLGYGNKLSDAFYTQKTRTSIFTFYKNRIIIPVEIGEAFYPFMYDCGASMFTLQTTPKKSISFKPLSYSDTLFDINNGETGQTHNVLGGKIGKPVKILSKVYKDIPVYIENSESEIFDEARVSGIIGNKLFLGNTIIIDFPNRKFTIIE